MDAIGNHRLRRSDERQFQMMVHAVEPGRDEFLSPLTVDRRKLLDPLHRRGYCGLIAVAASKHVVGGRPLGR